MSIRQHAQLSLTWNQVIAFRLARHHLSQRAPTKDLILVVDDMTGAQAQLISAAQLSLWSRLQDLGIADIEEAFNQRVLDMAACMRQTLFLVPSRKLAVFVHGTARHAEKEIRWALGKGVPERVIEAVIEATLGALDQPLSGGGS